YPPARWQGEQDTPPMVIFDATRPLVKSARTFGLSLARTGRHDRPPLGPSDADRAWAALNLNRDARDYEVLGLTDAVADRLALESALTDVLCRVGCPYQGAARRRGHGRPPRPAQSVPRPDGTEGGHDDGDRSEDATET